MQRDINTIPYVYAKVNEIVTDCLLLEKIRINYTRKMRINLFLPRMGKKITGTRLSPNTRYLICQPRLTDAIIVILSNYFLMSTRVKSEAFFEVIILKKEVYSRPIG